MHQQKNVDMFQKFIKNKQKIHAPKSITGYYLMVHYLTLSAWGRTI